MIAQKNIVLRASNLFWLGAVAICGAILFYVSLEARHAEEKLYRTYAEIKKEEETIKVLRAEIAYLTSPDRLQTLADKHLPLNETNKEQFASLDTLEKRPSIMANTNMFAHETMSTTVQAMLAPSIKPSQKPAQESAQKFAAQSASIKKETQVASQVTHQETRKSFDALLQKISFQNDN